jgi:hypothetical protein
MNNFNYVLISMIIILMVPKISESKKKNKKKSKDTILNYVNVDNNKTKVQHKRIKKRKTTPRELCRRYGLKSSYCRAPFLFYPKYKTISTLIRSNFRVKFGSVDGLRKRVRLSALIPDFSMEYGRWDDIDRNYSSKPGETNWLDEASGQKQLFKIKISWQPQYLIFNPNEITILREKRRELIMVESLIDRGRRLFFKWKRELIELARWPSLRRMLSLEEIESSLNELTGSMFSPLLREKLK